MWADAVYATDRTYPGNYTMYVPSPVVQGKDAFHISARRTRLGINIDGPPIPLFRGAKSGAKPNAPIIVHPRTGPMPLGRYMIFRCNPAPTPRLVLFANHANVVFQHLHGQGLLYTQDTINFTRDVAGIGAIYAQGAQQALGMAMLAEAEGEFLKAALCASSPEFVGEFWLGKLSELVIWGDFDGFRRPKAVRFSHGQF